MASPSINLEIETRDAIKPDPLFLKFGC